MANENKKITDLVQITNTADNDLFIIEDVSVPETKRIPLSNLKTAVFQSRSVSITDGTHTGTAATLEASGGNLTLNLPSTITATLDGNASTATTATNAGHAQTATTADSATTATTATTADKATLSDKSILAGIFYSSGITLQTASFRYIEVSNGYGTAGRPTLNNGDTFLLYLENDINPLLSSDALNGTNLYIQINGGAMYQTDLYSTRRMPQGLYFIRYIETQNTRVFYIGAASSWNVENGTRYKTLSTLSNDDFILTLKKYNDTDEVETYRATPATIKDFLATYFLQKSNNLSDLSNKNSAIRYLTESAQTLPSGAANSVKIPVTDNGMGGVLQLSDIFTFYGLSNTNGTLTYTGNATNDEYGNQISSTYAKTNDVLSKLNNLSDLNSTDRAISNLMANASNSGIYTGNATIFIKNAGIPTPNATGTATISQLLVYLKNQLYTEYNGTETLTKSAGVELTDKDFRNHYIEIVLTGARSNNTILGNYAVQTTQNSGSWRIPFQWYNGSSFETHYLILSINSSSLSIKISGIDSWTSQSFSYYIKVWN